MVRKIFISTISQSLQDYHMKCGKKTKAISILAITSAINYSVPTEVSMTEDELRYKVQESGETYYFTTI